MRVEAARRRPPIGVKWIDDRLPSLGKIHRLAIPFDLILLSAVW
jgi:hypothetical protein